MKLVGKKVVVTTSHRGVFFGELSEINADAKTCSLKDAQMCVYWSSDVRGFIGLAANGPTAGCRVSPSAPYQHLEGYTSITLCGDTAIAAWESAPWRS